MDFHDTVHSGVSFAPDMCWPPPPVCHKFLWDHRPDGNSPDISQPAAARWPVSGGDPELKVTQDIQGAQTCPVSSYNFV